jgi:tetratricopeptide (TPR) repeat protein
VALTRYVAVCLVLVAALTTSRAHAETGDALLRARTHFEAGRALYNLGNYTDAIREFSAGYQLVPRPQFLVNLGQAFRKLNDLERARDMYKKYLSEAPPNDPDREQVRQIVADLDQQIAALPPKPEPAPVVAKPVTPAPEAVVATTAPPPEKKSFIRKHWWIIPVAAVVVAGVAVGAYFGTRPSGQVDCSAATLGCIDTMSMR